MSRSVRWKLKIMNLARPPFWHPWQSTRSINKKKVGSRLIESGLEKLKEAEGNIVFVYGDPEFYGKFGFHADTANDFPAPFDLEYPFGWQALILKDWSDKTTPAATSCVSALSDPDLW